MKISQKEKTLLIIVFILMALAAFFMLGVKPMWEGKSELEAEIKEQKSKWSTVSSKVEKSFRSIGNDNTAEKVYATSKANFEKKLETLMSNKDYKIAKDYKSIYDDLKLLNDKSIFNNDDEFYVYTNIIKPLLEDLIAYDDFIMSDLSESFGKLKSADGKTEKNYKYVSSTINISHFTCNTINDYYTLLNKLESCGFIVVKSRSITTKDGISGNISFEILLTPTNIDSYVDFMAEKTEQK